LQPGVFAKSIAESARALPLFANHAHDQVPVGKASRWTEAADGLYGEWLMDTRAEAREIVRLVNEDLLGGMSVGFLPIHSDWDNSGDKPRVVRHEARLLETSLVAVPAHSTARVLAVRSAGEPDDPTSRVIPTPRLTEFKAWLASVR
jgi:HK97 family phage prohead protease